MTISAKDWSEYIRKLSGLNEQAAAEMRAYVLEHGYADMPALVDYAYALATKYGEGAAALSAAMYDATAEMEGKLFDPAELAETPGYQEVAKTVQGVAKQSQSAEMMGSAVGRLVKRTGADTTLQNAIRDGAEFAWIPAGDTCAFCITLASRGWQRASKEAIRGGHAEHIHSHCDCTYAIRFDGKSNVAGYDPDKYLQMYEDAEGGTWQEKVNSMRREQYAENRERIREQQNAAYAAKKETLTGSQKSGIVKRSDAESGARFLQRQLNYVWNGEKNFIPKGTEFERVTTFAGAGTNEKIKDIKRLIADYGGTESEWKKQAGTIYSDKYELEVHWYELNGEQHDEKLKNRKERKK